MKKIIISLIVLIALAFGGVSVYVSMIDWNQHKTKIAAQIEKLTGKRVVFDGQVALSFLPRPHLTAENIKIYDQNNNAGNVPLAVIRKMMTDLSLTPLLKGQFEIEQMALENADILVEVMPDGRLNWYSEISDFQRDSLDNTEVALNSVMLKDATVEIVNQGLGTDITLKHLNAEITAQSLHGPYRIDGNFMKNDKPAGFALNLGTLSESFGTSVSLVLTHPSTESSARFDGQILSNYTEIEGNVAIESKNPAKFANELTSRTLIPEDFNYPFLGSTVLKINSRQFSLSNLTIKYGDHTAGSGNLLVPFEPSEDQDKRKIEFAFELTDLDLMPLIGMAREQIKKYDAGEPYIPDTDFDLAVDVRAVKAIGQNGTIRNFNLSFDYINDIFNIKTLSGLLPGDTDLQINGDIFENEQKPAYDFQVNMTSQDFLKFLDWIDLKPNTYAPSTYRGAQVSTRLSGTLSQIKVAPLSMTLDNNSVSGVLGVIRGPRTKLFMSLQSEKINFDNYLPQLTAEEMKLSLPERIKLSLNKLSYLNDYDVQFNAKLMMGIYNKTSFENLEVKFASENGQIQIDRLHVDDMASAAIDLKGTLLGLGTDPSVRNLKYSFETTDFETFRNQFDLPLPRWPLITNAKKITADGIVTGNTDLISLKAVTSIDEPFLRSVYTGQLFKQDNMFNFKGKLELNTEFVRFLNSVGLNYHPKEFPSGVFTFSGVVAGNPESWTAGEVNAFVSANNFKGNFDVSHVDGRPSIVANIETNRFEFDRLIYNPETRRQNVAVPTKEKAEFLKTPVWDTTNIDYDFYKTFDLKGNFKSQRLNYKTYELTGVSADLLIKDNKIQLQNFAASLNRGVGRKSPIKADLTIDLTQDPRTSGKVTLSDYEIDKLGGTQYALTRGILKADWTFDAPAHSIMAFADGLSGKLSFDISQATFSGWNLDVIEKDLETRDKSDNLKELTEANLTSGQTNFNLIGAEVEFDKGKYTLKDGLFAADDVSVDFSGSGQLKTWQEDLAFRLVFDKLKDKVVPMNFGWTGTLASPELQINIKELTDKYDSYWNKIAEEKKAAEDARIKALNDSMAKTQEKVDDLKDMAEHSIIALIDRYQPQSDNAEIKSIYDTRKSMTTDIIKDLDQMKAKAKAEFTTDDIATMDGTLETMSLQLTDLLREVKENIKKDYRLKSNTLYGEIKGIYDNSKKKAENYQKTLNAYVLRLLQLNSLVVLDQDPRASDYKDKIETDFRNMEDLHLRAVQVHDQITSASDYKDLDVKHALLVEIKEKSNALLKELNDSLENLFGYAKDLVRKEEKRNDEELKQNQSKVQEPEPQKDEDQSERRAEQVDTPSDNTPPAAAPEISAEPAAPLIKPVETQNNDIVSYSGRTAVSGSVTRASNKIPASAGVAAPTTSLLRPIDDQSVSAEGTITKKK